VFQPVDSGSPAAPQLHLTFEGHGDLNIRGRILPGGADAQIICDDGLTEADAQYVLETDRGALVYVRNRGLRHAPPDVMAKLLAGVDLYRFWRTLSV
jgi:hypothetical protein